ncbi:3-methyl-2-oxobutanoate hydroxymethyltransferase [Pseudogulbenkiania sp. NH8B]|uniref:3-methyl-2-oxobutanoate hydroxymethyltransferase n=1 Tax=Pseudogulbenkiania ferrooxidans 2002 TaxID=279714 RepID=B9Z4H4_9NEIS|nr:MULTISPECIES: 3-methyl-2-oxobutanoate hydroxymethyltransferase [Pseudogulbenkiania]EEG08056.1 3-methyl-2-oxobutanoate hydroxymethyltransferase [Pseudogulbenkiania ferrooxidans 2002]BAK77800.1 3-methyl-2-oxobutanoate hydroxymethyltransferase [Pseudogulbenkiania sp. NH8B]
MKINVNTLFKMAAEGQKITMLTCYDTSFATLLDDAGVEILLVGDSLGMVIQGEDSTLPVTMEQMEYHTRCVARGAKNALVLSDMPFGSYQESPQQAFANAARLMQAGAHMVKVEGGAFMAETTRFLVERGIPVCSHIGLTPQFVNSFGGYRVQGKSENDAERILHDASALADAGASLVLMECVPAALAKRVSDGIAVPTIGIGAGVDVSGQVLVLHDILGVYPGRKARFVKNFMAGADSIQAAVAGYVTAVKARSFPAEEHCF